MPPSPRALDIHRARRYQSNSPLLQRSRTLRVGSPTNPSESTSTSTDNSDDLYKRLETTQESIKKRTSWVWQYFEPGIVKGKIKFFCKLPSAYSASDFCSTTIAEDPKGCTKSLSRHLEQQHRLKSSKKINQLEERESAEMVFFFLHSSASNHVF
jgi:hypothetical protein